MVDRKVYSATMNKNGVSTATEDATYQPRCQRCQRRYNPVGTRWEEFEVPWLRGVDPYFSLYREKRLSQRVIRVCGECNQQLNAIGQQVAECREELKRIWTSVTSSNPQADLKP